MTDRELIHKAAQAAGYGIVNWEWCQRADAYRYCCGGDWIEWNPLTNDGDALRLAMAAGIGISKPSMKFPNVRRAFLSDLEVFQATDDDPMAATRRAIVLAAASKVSQ